MLKTSLQKIQLGLNELILYYQKMANKIINSSENHEINTTFFKCILDFDDNYCNNISEESTFTAIWYLDQNTSENNLNDISKKDIKNQLIAFSYLIPYIESIYAAAEPEVECYYFHFEKTDLFTSYPLSSDCEDGFFEIMKNYTIDSESYQCMDNEGKIYDYFKFKCEAYFVSMLKSKTNAFDNNFLSNENRTIFITNYYGPTDEYLFRELTMCIEFYDPITKGKAYICSDYIWDDMNDSMEELNINIPGYFFIANVGYNHALYFPNCGFEPKTISDNIFGWDVSYKLEEKIYFYDNIKNILSSNYLDILHGSEYDEVFVNGKNSDEQYFLINGEKNNYAIYPIILENLNGQKEHVFSIIYIYNKKAFIEKVRESEVDIELKIVCGVLFFILIDSGLLYLIYLTFNAIAKYIVIPIKNVNYMLKGINIGGNNRLDYLNFLKKKQNEDLEKLEKIYLLENKFNNNNENDLTENETNNDLINELENDINSKDSNNKKNNLYYYYNRKYDLESKDIEKEFSFNDFDDNLLQFRPMEIENLVKSLIDLKSALNLTSGDRPINKIIEYSLSEKTFQNFKNKEGANICQSNIGNLQSQLKEYDKAIYHLALSLQDNQLKKFIKKNINEEFDENDALLNKISNAFNKGKNKDKKNLLVEKQLNNTKGTFSQKNIGILINTRYCRLIHSYYIFFKNLRKLKKANNDITNINGQYMNTSFHNINYYHKILIQYIYLSYIKNDLIKIGESILDYIEFLIKFKFKTALNDNYFLQIKNRFKNEYIKKQEFKKKIFEKIIKWFNLFDDYISYIKDNTSLSDLKNVINDYSHDLNSKENKSNLDTQSSFMFRINVQKSFYLKGKFSFYCKNYNDALYYFIRAAKKKDIISDGLIKKRSLKYIYKLLIIMEKVFQFFRLNNTNMKKELNDLKKDKNKFINKRINIRKKSFNTQNNNRIKGVIAFGKEIEIIKRDLIKDITECNAKQEKDIIILIDFNIYNNEEEEISNNQLNNIDLFIENTTLISNNYLSSYDRLAVFIHSNEYHLICPLMRMNKIDLNNLSKDLIYFKKNNNFGINKKEEEYDINSNEFNLNLEVNNNINDNSQEDSYDSDENQEFNFNKIKQLIKTINYINNYSKVKAEIKGERYIILFTNLLNIELNLDEQTKKIFDKINKDKELIFLLVSKYKKIYLENDNNFINNADIFKELILGKFGDKSEIIDFENMKKIKSLLSNNSVIKDEIFYPNEIYK